MATETTADTSDTTAPSSPARPAAFFDLDGTLIAGSSNIPLALAAFRAGFVTPAQLYRDLRNNASFLLKGASDERSAQVRDRILAAVEGREVAELAALGETFMHKLVAKVRPVVRDLLDEHGDEGHERVLISASPTEIVSRLAEEVGMEFGIGTTSEHIDGIYTGRLSRPFCYREGKAEVLRQIAEERGYDLTTSFAYSDSISDLPMLRAVGTPVAVNPDTELRRLALAEGWRIVETGGVTRGSLPVPTPSAVIGAAVSLPGRTISLGSRIGSAGARTAWSTSSSIASRLAH